MYHQSKAGLLAVSLWCLLFLIVSISGISDAETSGNIKFFPIGLTPIFPRRNLKQDKYSIIMLTSVGRFPMLSKTLKKFFQQKPKYCEKIYLYWNEFNKSVPAPKLSDYNITNPPVPFEIIDTRIRKLYSRFLIPDDIETQTIYSIDDDIYVTFNELDKHFNHFTKKGFPFSVVGYYATLWRDGKYQWKKRNDYNIVMTGLSLMRVELFETFNFDKYQGIRDYIGENNNCEDIAMNFVVYDTYKTRPIYVDIKHQYMGRTKGLSSKPTHKSARLDCLRFFDKYLGFQGISEIKNISESK